MKTNSLGSMPADIVPDLREGFGEGLRRAVIQPGVRTVVDVGWTTKKPLTQPLILRVCTQAVVRGRSNDVRDLSVDASEGLASATVGTLHVRRFSTSRGHWLMNSTLG